MTILHAPTQTARLTLAPVSTDDAPLLFRFLGDTDAMAMTTADASEAACASRMAAHRGRAGDDGFGPWTVRHDGVVVGWGGLYVDPAAPEWGPELGYAFDRHWWGRGLAHELAAAAVGWADGALDCQSSAPLRTRTMRHRGPF